MDNPENGRTNAPIPMPRKRVTHNRLKRFTSTATCYELAFSCRHPKKAPNKISNNQRKVKAEAYFWLNASEDLHVIFGQLPVEDVQVLLHTVRVGALGKDRRAPLHAPPEDHLPRTLLRPFGNL
jgi:hypothetical protein